MAKEKVLGAYTSVSGNMLKILKDAGYNGTHNQFRIICKCKSMVDANRKCQAAGLGDKVFRSGWCCETGNKVETKICETTDIAFGIEQTGKKYITIEQIQERLAELTM